MPKKPKKSSEEKSAEEYFPIEEDYKRSTEKQTKESTPINKRITEKAVKSPIIDVHAVEKEYHKPDKKQVELYLGFYQSQREGDLIHSPKNCIPGSGWNIVSTSLENITIPEINQKDVKVIKLIIQKEDRRQVVFYWFQSRGRFIASEYMQKIYLVIDSIIRHRTDGAFVRLISPIIDKDEQMAVNYLKRFSIVLIKTI